MKDEILSTLGVILLWACIFGFAFILSKYWYQIEILWAIFVAAIIVIPLTIWILSKLNIKRKSP